MIRNRLWRSCYRYILSLVLLISVICGLSAAVDAYPAQAADSDLTEAVTAVLDYELAQTENDSCLDWLNNELCDQAGAGSEWYAMALLQLSSIDAIDIEPNDFALFAGALQSYAAEHGNTGAVEKLRIALTLQAMGCGEDYVQEVCSAAIGQQGIMSWVFGLHLLNNMPADDERDAMAAEAVEELLALQLTDGGWALNGTSSDTDVTAMTLQALAPYYIEADQVQSILHEKDDLKEEISGSVSKALPLLAERQQPAGDCTGFDGTSCESTAQVLLALSSLGLDQDTRSDFIHNGNSLLDGLMLYRQEDGSYCHKTGGETNNKSTQQSLCALVGCMMLQEDAGTFYLFPDTEISADISAVGSEDKLETDADKEVLPQTDKMTDDNRLKILICLLPLLTAVIVSIIFFARGRRRISRFLFVWIVAAICTLLLALTDIQTPLNYYQTPEENAEQELILVGLSITCEVLNDQSDLPDYIPADGIMLAESTYNIPEGSTVYDLLVQAAKSNQLHIENNGTAAAAYIAGIGYLYEFEYGNLSGWIYSVNGVQAAVGCSDYVLSQGDDVSWQYSLDMGRDLQ